MSCEKVSIITLRLIAEEAARLLKSITGKKNGSEAIKHIVKEYSPILCALLAGSTGERRIAAEVSGTKAP